MLVRSRLLLDNVGDLAGRAASRAARVEQVENVVLEQADVIPTHHLVIKTWETLRGPSKGNGSVNVALYGQR